MKNLKAVSNKSKSGVTPLYYSIRKDAVYTVAADDRYYITDLIRFNSEKEIENTVKKFLCC